MRHVIRLSLVVTLFCLFILPSCVVVTGQRLSMHYDAKADRLDFLLFYDGIHDSDQAFGMFGPDNQHDPEQAKKAVAEFVANGDILLVDWFCHIKMKDVKALAAKESAPAFQIALAKAMAASVKTRAIGHMRDEQGQMCAAQLITISHASKFVGHVNKAINGTILSNDPTADASPEWKRTLAKIVAAAKKNHTWVTIDGHSLEFTIPIHHREWAQQKAKFVNEALREFINRMDDQDGAEQSLLEFQPVLQAFTSVATSIRETDDALIVTLGRKMKPTTMRIVMTDRDYNKSLEADVAKHLPEKLDSQISTYLLKPKGVALEVMDGTKMITQWGPPEEAARVLYHEAVGGNVNAKDALAKWVTQWNAEQGCPDAPTVTPDKQMAFIQAWAKWYQQMRRFPLPAEESDE